MGWEDRPYYRDEPPRVRVSVPMPGRMTMIVMGACLAVFFIGNVFRANWIFNWFWLTFDDGTAFKHPWRWVTYAYLHGGGAHLFWNLLGLYFFLTPLERVWGWKRAFTFYTLGTVAGAITFGVMCIFYPFPGIVGASGGILAALGACAYLFPEMMIFMIIPIRVFAALAGVLYLLTVAGDRNPSDAAHLGGLVFGFFAPYYGRHVWSRLSEQMKTTRRRNDVAAEQREQEQIDRILQKVHASGMNSLSWSERRTLKKATERQRQREAARASRVR